VRSAWQNSSSLSNGEREGPGKRGVKEGLKYQKKLSSPLTSFQTRSRNVKEIDPVTGRGKGHQAGDVADRVGDSL